MLKLFSDFYFLDDWVMVAVIMMVVMMKIIIVRKVGIRTDVSQFIFPLYLDGNNDNRR